ncbi:MAG: hypothetical protein SFT68_00160 [Rickettsiaceae bacterium]|nr:hypothetical protein [Rickettsiaceae bacterium]
MQIKSISQNPANLPKALSNFARQNEQSLKQNIDQQQKSKIVNVLM